MIFTTILYNIVEAYSEWLYREHGEPPDDMKPRTIKNFFIRIWCIGIYYPVICPLLFFDERETRRRTRRCLDECFRMAEDPRTTRDDLINVVSKTGDGGEEELADAILRITRREPNP